MPRKKQKGPPARSNRAGPAAPKSAPTSAPKVKGPGPGSSGKAKDAPQKKHVQQNQRPIVPFLRRDRVLLIGEGDFSFARSLATQYKCRRLCATCYDSRETLLSKYPQAEHNIEDILQTSKPQSKSTETEREKDESGPSEGSQSIPENPDSNPSPRRFNPKVLFSVDACKLGAPAGGGKEIKTGFPRRERKPPAWKTQQSTSPTPPPSGPWDVICFNFPHVGGLSTDVNRQVRANQELLVSFFKACVPLLSTPPPAVDSDDEWDFEDGSEEDSDEEADESADQDVQTSGKAARTGPGQILVSLFEAEPYTLWNIKDLARHAGLQVVTSFRFPWASYEGYSHARTLGEVEGKHGGRGGWRGEDREARMYVFEVKREVPRAGKKKRNRDDSSDSE
ncbi:hypothetical protein N7492_002822 [Penicillium capsulatum]|uniref:25S rRNA (uridine-N(3))-methyltransferase BMT5-like domain-containing protein n=1 Tax=Penicillium capsulatum TaxID=69766 RepID=A0A9W9IKP6_9EURO|nr:hypothetical protein N7492_002822 [Penicillium capsulatum]